MFQWWRNRSKIYNRGELGYDDGNPNVDYLEFKDLLSWYDVHRKYIESEGNLINHRVGWVLSIHGFLYASYGLVLTNQMNQIFGSSTNFLSSTSSLLDPLQRAKCSIFSQSEIYLLGISIIGMSISASGAWGAYMAQNAMKNVARSFRIQNRVRVLRRGETYSVQRRGGIPHFKYTKNPIKYVFEEGIFMPGLTGGGSKIASRWGSRTSISIPAVLFIGWFISLIALWKVSSVNLEIVCKHDMWNMLSIYF